MWRGGRGEKRFSVVCVSAETLMAAPVRACCALVCVSLSLLVLEAFFIKRSKRCFRPVCVCVCV